MCHMWCIGVVCMCVCMRMCVRKAHRPWKGECWRSRLGTTRDSKIEYRALPEEEEGCFFLCGHACPGTNGGDA